ncbi:Piso0_001725 [Millerozyma farinosa CBS 7064]|uniref:Piso0_001725 protein n=1 Tax=Pichia sorbitophila (strain ATCC MYA-4447 / BCRC 22081 / CBS 7064 / NBRC 10061 / NRRL Y-12695) TaxID=559304 RepID=G8YLJ8_PICSO|nr:Piso0_001725 [Millerozyma farinosa CBS 7064]
MSAPATAPEDAAKVTQAETAVQTAQKVQANPESDHEEQGEEQDEEHSEKPASSGNADEEPITKEPAAQDNMYLSPNKETNSDGTSTHRTSMTVSEQGSGYQREENECTEFCTDFLTCFGLFDACCPASGEGYLANFATCCGIVLMSCTKC